ncbi:MAG: hypothetical protein AB7F59_02465 [Bdellovibrionales bacterium]
MATEPISNNIQTVHLNKDSLDIDYVYELSTLLNQFCELIKKKNIYLIPTTSEFSLYRKLNPEKQRAIYDGFLAYYTGCLGALNSGAHLDDDRTLALWVLKSLNWRFHPDLFGHLTKNDVIEIYNKDSVQIFRTFNFFNLISYTLEEILCYEWWELYRRPEFIQKELVTQGTRILEKKVEETLFNFAPNHEVEEIFSVKRNIAEISEKLVSPPYLPSGQITGFIHAFEIVNVRPAHPN